MASPESEFYSSYFSTTPTLPCVETGKAFSDGKRYYICKQSLDNQPVKHRELIVELGCGNGSRLLFLKERYGFQHAKGFDLGFCREYNLGTSSSFAPSNLNEKWQLDDGSVDVLIAMMLIEHLFDPFFCFREISRALKDDGRAFINLPLITSIKNRLRLLAGLIPITSVPYARWEKERHWDGFHLHYFTIRSIHDLARSAGLSVVSINSVGAFHRVKNLLPSVLCNEISFELRRAHSPR